MGRSRAERRERSGKFVNLFSVNITLGWEVVRQVAVEEALQMVALKQWREIFFDNGELAGVQPLHPEPKKTLHQVLVDRLVAVTITLPELKRNAGLYGRSHTIGMVEWKRMRRQLRIREEYRRIVEPEDAIELAIEKVRHWPFPASVKRDAHGNAVTNERGEPVFADRAVRVYPRAPKA